MKLDLTRQINCVEAINEFLLGNPDQQAVVCCRQGEYQRGYEQGRVKLNQLNGAVQLQDLTNEQIEKYFKDLKRFEIWQDIKQKPELKELAKSPLLLTMIVVACQPSREIKNKQELFDAYIDEQFLRRLDRTHYPSSQAPFDRSTTQHYLVWLAKKLKSESKTELLIETMQLSWLANSKQYWSYWLTFGTVFGLMFGISDCLQRTFYRHQHGNLIGILIGGVFLGIAGSIIGMYSSRFNSFNDSLISRIIGGVAGSLIGVLIGLITNLYPSSFDALTSGLILWLSVGLTSRIETFESFRFSQTTLNTLKKGVTFGIISGLLAVPIAVLVCDITSTLILKKALVFRDYDYFSRYVFCLFHTGIVSGLIAGVIVGLVLGLRAETRARVVANQGIRETAKNTFILAFICFPIVLIAYLVVYPYSGFSLKTVSSDLKVAFLYTVWIAIALVGRTCIQHTILRLILWRSGSIPWNYESFLRYASDRRFIQRIGGRYRFIHDTLREHFAQMQM